MFFEPERWKYAIAKGIDKKDMIFTTAKNILRGIDFCLARVLREQTEPDSLSVLEKEETQTFEYEEGHVYVSIFIDYDNRSVAAYFHTT